MPTSATKPAAERSPYLPAALALAGFGTLLAVAWPGSRLNPPPSPTPSPATAAAVETRLDPNTAAWWQLERLPGVGASLAHAIVDERERRAAQWPGQTAFPRPDSLLHVRGLGPRKLEPILRYLRFPPATAGATSPADSVDTTPPPP